MQALKYDIITQLKKDILTLQGFKPLVHAQHPIDLGTINSHFPHSRFPLGVNHEFICNKTEDLAASSGFIAGILSSLLKKGGAAVWISSSQIIFPPALIPFGIEPSQIIFVHLKNQKEVLWTIEEALKCEGLTAVIGEVSFIDLTVSRRLQLAAEQSKVTGFLLRYQPRQSATTACVCRWQVHHLKSETENELPGVGYPMWEVELLRARNGKTGTWQLEWAHGRFNEFLLNRSSINKEHKQAV